MHILNDRKILFDYLAAGTTVLTPNKRLSQDLIHDFFYYNNKPVSTKPPAFPYDLYRNLLFKEAIEQSLAPAPLLLNAHQFHFLWQEIILASQTSISLSLAKAIEKAWAFCQFWNINIEDPVFSYHELTQEFQYLARLFMQKLQQLNALTEYQQVPYIIQHLKTSAKPLIWACFNDFNPQQKQLQDYFTSYQCTQWVFDYHQENQASFSYIAHNESEEWEQIISWLEKQNLSDKKKKIGVVIPDLQHKSKVFTRQLQQRLPQLRYNITLGDPFSSYPLIAHAFSWLSLEANVISYQQASLLLHSPFLADAQSEMLSRAEFYENALCLKEEQCSMGTFVSALEKHCPTLAACLKKIAIYPSEDRIENWISLFQHRLLALGFPGQSPLTSEQYQYYQRFIQLLEEFQQLSVIKNCLTQQDALQTLKSLAQATIFQPQTQHHDIQILGILEASGCYFDSLWVSGLTATTLPQPLNYSCFIPINLQKDKKMPLADLQHESLLGQRTLKRFTAASSHCIFSYPQFLDDEPCLPSPLIPQLASYIPPLFPSSASMPLPVSAALHSHSEAYRLSLHQDEQVSGGTLLLANQAKCPFRAFAAHRLHCKKNLRTGDGLNAQERGQIIHKTMEWLWTELQTQENLLQLEEDDLEKLTTRAIHLAIKPFIELRVFSFSPLIQEIEIAKLQALVAETLSWEKSRPSFKIHCLEKAFELQLGDTTLAIRVDRIDEFPCGKKAVIDYKSSLPLLLPWTQERPEEPQLLLYALLDEQIQTVLFAEMKRGKFKCLGISAAEEYIPHMRSLKDQSWDEARSLWKNQLNLILGEFKDGFCEPRPLKAQICQQCDYNDLCRYHYDSP